MSEIRVEDGFLYFGEDAFKLGDIVNIEADDNTIENATIQGISKHYLVVAYRNRRNRNMMESLEFGKIRNLSRND